MRIAHRIDGVLANEWPGYYKLVEFVIEKEKEILVEKHQHKETGLKLKPSKDSFFQQKIKYLGHRVLAKGIWLSCDNLRVIAEYPEPMTYTAVCGFLGIISHYRWFVKDFARITEPLHDYMRGDLHKKKKETLTVNREAKEAFHVLKKAIMMALVLYYSDSNKEYLLETDASKLGLGAVLYQKQSDGRYHPMAFGSQAL